VNNKSLTIYILVSIFLISFAIYFPGLHGPYVLDDGENITNNKAVALNTLTIQNLYDAALSNNSALKRPIATLSFGLNHYFSNAINNPFPFKVTNLIIHICNSLLVFFLTVRLLRLPSLQRFIPSKTYITAGFITAAWALHPIQLTSVLYVVQRMNSLSALFVLSGLIVFLIGRQILLDNRKKGYLIMACGLFSGIILGLGGKENAILLPLYALSIEWALLKRDAFSNSDKKHLFYFYFSFIFILFLIGLVYLSINSDLLADGYLERSFTFSERLLTQPRVLWFYISLLLYPNVHRLGLFHDDLSISQGLIEPLTTLPALLAIALLVVFSILRNWRYPILAFAVLWFISGHVIESGILPLQIAFEHRNYLPSYGIIFSMMLYISTFTLNTSTTRSFRQILPMLILLVLAYTTWSRSHTWSNIILLAESEAQNHQQSGEANNFASRAYLYYLSDFHNSIKYGAAAIRADPGDAGQYIDLQITLAVFSQITNDSLKNKRGIDLGKETYPWLQDLPVGTSYSIRNNNIKFTHNLVQSETILETLKFNSITVHTSTSLENLSSCIENQPKVCSNLREDALVWLNAAVENPRIIKHYKAILLSHIARLHAVGQNYRLAYKYIERAASTEPSRLSYRLGCIEYLLRLGKLSEAKQLLDNYNQSDKWSNTERRLNAGTVLFLQKYYQSLMSN